MDLYCVKHKNYVWYTENSSVSYGFYELFYALHSQCSQFLTNPLLPLPKYDYVYLGPVSPTSLRHPSAGSCNLLKLSPWKFYHRLSI